ncbi:MAG TPA: N-6 DNA methylase, partial [Pseudomonadales bacterium]|nr:N-6 DNA methylase [Pseudomonadales bacterium]
AKVTDTFHAWQRAGAPVSRRPGMAESDLRGNGYEDVAGFCYSASLDDLKKHDFVLTPGRYVGAEEQEDDGELFADKMARLTSTLKEQFAESSRLEAEIKKNLAGLGYAL